MTLSMPAMEISFLGSVRHIRPLPSDSTMQTPPVSAMRKFAPLTATGVERNCLRKYSRGFGQILGLIAQVWKVHGAGEKFAHLVAILVQRGHNNMGWFVVPQLHDQFGKIGFDRVDSGGFQRAVQASLLGGHAFDLDDPAVWPCASPSTM